MNRRRMSLLLSRGLPRASWSRKSFVRSVRGRCYSGADMVRLPRWSQGLSLHAISLVVGCTPEARVGIIDAGVTDSDPGDSSGNDTTGSDTASDTSDTTGDACSPLTAVVRDFLAEHPDFEAYRGDIATPGLVEPRLGADGRPVYSGLVVSPPQMTGRDWFLQWFQDVPGTNITIDVEIPLKSSQAGLTFDDLQFFPLDGRGWGNEGYVDHDDIAHNYHFTAEIRTSFVYERGQSIKLTGDDDFWVFVDGTLVIDLGGLHPAQAATATLDDFGLEPGTRYSLDIFHAERRSVDSSFRLETNIECLTSPL